ncbi:MAG TPA: CopG family antitoxin [Thermoanaerobaculia bacterium]|jgi:predicted DNA binding CopG/RHH family protein|nr:CopG family antitoxin [Thermoanaerobaculia bacterium]
MKSAKLPQLDSIDELAKFWDTHDLTEFDAQLEEVTEPIFERESGATMVLRLEPAELEAVKKIARTRGVEQSDLLREWVLEKLGSIRG